jgi:hypothetical protein
LVVFGVASCDSSASSVACNLAEEAIATPPGGVFGGGSTSAGKVSAAVQGDAESLGEVSDEAPLPVPGALSAQAMVEVGCHDLNL